MAINRDKVLEAAQKYVEKRKYDKAVVEFQKIVEADPNDARTLLKIGDLQAKQALYAEAISTYETVGKLYANQGFALKAIAVYKQIREIIAKHVPMLEERYGHIAPKLAELYQQLGLTSDALAALDEVATRLQRQQRDPEAIDVFRKIVELDPTNPLPHLRLAEALSRVQDADGAVFEFKTAASQLAGIGRRDDAIKVLERLLHHKPDNEQARICAELYLSRGGPQDGMQALSKLQICFQANPRDFDTLNLLARAFNAIGQGGKAIEVQKEMARVARDSGKPDLFREIVERLVRVAPQDDGVRKLQGQLGGNIPSPTGSGPALGASGSYAGQNPSNAQTHQVPVATTQSYRGAPPSPPMSAPSLQRPQTSPVVQAEAQAQEIDYDDVEELEEAQLEEEVYEEAEPAEAEAAYLEGGEDLDVQTADGSTDAPHAHQLQEEQPELADQLAQILQDAGAFRRVRLYNKAIDTLRGGLELDPRSMDLHEIYRDILIEAGHTDEAVQEMLVIASLYVDALDGDSAARALQDVLAFDPQNARAVEMLQELGYEIVDENDEQQPEAYTQENDQVAAPAAYAEQAYEEQPAGELPAYELEGGAESEEAQYVEADEGGQTEPPPYNLPDEGGLPSFPLDDAEQAYADAASHVPGIVGDVRAQQPRALNTEPPTSFFVPGQRQNTSIPPAASIGAVAASRELEDALEEAEFFCSRGLFDDARSILEEQLQKHPKNPLLRERLGEVDAQVAQQRGSGAREKPREQDRSFDIAASLDALESLDYGEQAPQASAFQDPNQQIDVEEVFAKFKEGVAKQISVDDSDSHYNLGIAYKEMMLVDDAIREFEVAARDPKRECVCRSMIGMIEIERGNLNEAIDAFIQGLNSPHKDPQQETVLCYEIGAAYEAKKLGKDALSYYQKAMRRDPNYKDVQERVRRLSKNEPKQSMRAAVGADDEFDRAFDDLLGKG